MQTFYFCFRFLFEAILPSHLGMQPHGVTLDYKFHVINHHVIADKIKEPTIPQHTSFVQRRLTYFGQYTGPNSYLKYYTLKVGGPCIWLKTRQMYVILSTIFVSVLCLQHCAMH